MIVAFTKTYWTSTLGLCTSLAHLVKMCFKNQFNFAELIEKLNLAKNFFGPNLIYIRGGKKQAFDFFLAVAFFWTSSEARSSFR